MYLDKTVARRSEAEVVLISRKNFIVFTPMLHEVAGEIYIRAILSIHSGAFSVTSRSTKPRWAIDLRARRFRAWQEFAMSRKG